MLAADILCAYGVKETTDLDMLGIDNSQTSREAHTALAQIAWEPLIKSLQSQ